MAPRSATTASNTQSLPFQIRGTSFTLLALKVIDPHDPAFFSRLADTLALAPGFYRNAPIILDLGQLARHSSVDLGRFCQGLRELALVPVGVQGATTDWQARALAAGLAVFPAGRAADPARARAAAPPRPAPARLVSDPVRSGQQVYAAESDLIVIGPVSRGAELLADGNIHVYGPLRGRAVAGMGGDRTARIFCRHFDADLVSIAGLYMVNEQMDPAFTGKSIQIRLDGDRLIFEPL